MDVITEKEKKELLKASELTAHYNEVVDRDSAYEMLAKKIEKVHEEQEKEEKKKAAAKKKSTSSRSSSTKSRFDQIIDKTTQRQIGREIARELTRGLLGVLGIK